MDSKPKESIGVMSVATALMKAGILVAKPSFDREGADLIGFTSVDDNGRFCRIQCKYRELKRRTSVVVPSDYVTGAFVLFLHLETTDHTRLFCFLPNDIERHFSRGQHKSTAVFRLAVTQKSLPSLTSDASLEFSAAKVAELFAVMLASSPEAEMGRAFAKVITSAQEANKARAEHDRLRQLVHDATVASLKKEAAEEHLETLEEYMAYIESQQKELPQ